MTTTDLPAYIQVLLTPSAYPHTVKEVELIQTHVSYLLIAGDFVYKFKKEVDFGFLDFSSLDHRKFFCHEEVRLNRRLCPDVYLGVVSVVRDCMGFVLGGEEDKGVEYGVKMKRLSEDLMMGEVIGRGELTRDHIYSIVEQLVPFYEGLPSSTDPEGPGSVTVVEKNVRDNFEITRPFVGTAVLSRQRFEKIENYCTQFLTNEDCFKRRIANGHIREGHGDLHSANICLTDPPALFDCIEFNRNLRFADVAADVGFLAMDLDFHGLSSLADAFIKCYVELIGDTELYQVLNFYKCYRAYVRGKINLLTAEDRAVNTVVSSMAYHLADRYFELAGEYSREG